MVQQMQVLAAFLMGKYSYHYHRVFPPRIIQGLGLPLCTLATAASTSSKLSCGGDTALGASDHPGGAGAATERRTTPLKS